MSKPNPPTPKRFVCNHCDRISVIRCRYSDSQMEDLHCPFCDAAWIDLWSWNKQRRQSEQWMPLPDKPEHGYVVGFHDGSAAKRAEKWWDKRAQSAKPQ